ncbi:MAG TPA: hypothetical protein VE130_00015 [Nitrososphaeraceae archaeon]|jgi:hypothetical protein|nr:hypothetical protein [Nitrososphaeraceae archaeon]
MLTAEKKEFQIHGAAAIIASGLSLIITFVFTQYFLLSNMPTDLDGRIILTEESIGTLDRFAIPSLVLVFSALLICSIGIYLLLNRIWPDWSDSNYRVMSRHFSARQVFRLSAITYFVLISLLSSTIVYNPIYSFVEMYGVSIPSIHILSCCGYPGSFPVMSLYITDNLGLMIVPSNMIIFFFLSILVGINIVSLIIISKQNLLEDKKCEIVFTRNRLRRILPSPIIGPLAGLFAGCPACSSVITLLPLFLGPGSTSSLSVLSTLSYQGSTYQTVAIISSFAILLVVPLYLLIKKKPLS